MSDNGYTIADLAAMRDLRWWHCTTGTENFEDFLARQSKIAMRAAITADTQQWPGRRYQEAAVSDDERQPIPTERDWLVSCGYAADTVDAYLAQVKAEDDRLAAARAEREAYERTWWYRARSAWREARSRVSVAWSVLRGIHECGEEW